MKNKQKLFEFVCELIDIQIKKYVALATFGVGPDARMNAKLVFDEVQELLGFAEQLLIDLEKQLQNKTSPLDFSLLFHQVTFYVEQEKARAYAGWLLDANNIHSPVKERVEQQILQLKEIALSASIDYSAPYEPITEIQKQCEYDSCAISFYILDLAKKIKENPEIELDNKIPIHARNVLKRNAITRYQIEEIKQPIEELHKKYNEFMLQSQLKKNTSVLSKEETKLYEVQHTELLKNLLLRYKQIEPTSNLFSTEHEWYKVTVNPVEKNKSASLFASKNPMLFGGLVVVSVIAIYMLIKFFSMQEENSFNLKF